MQTSKILVSLSIKNKVIMKTSNPVFEIELAEISGDNVQVFYILNDGELQEANISYVRLKQFTADMGLNSYCENEFTGDYRYYDIDIYIAENLEEVVKTFLQYTYNPFEAHSANLTKLITQLNGAAA